MHESLIAYFERISDSCIECGLCARVQREGDCPAHEYGPFARDFMEESARGELSSQMDFAVFTCALCGECTSECPVSIDAAEFTRNARFAVHAADPVRVADYRPMLTDRVGNIFSGLLDVQKVTYPDALADDACKEDRGESLFLPGCTLSAYAPELTRATMAYLCEMGEADCMTAYCCGNPLRGIGVLDRYDTYTGQLTQRMLERGVKRIVAACPNCFYSLDELQKRGTLDAGIQLVCLPELLVHHGVRIDAMGPLVPGLHTFAVHDSCPDRFERRFARSIRSLLPEGSDVLEMEHAGLDAICCGSGGMVSFADVKVCETRRARRLEEFERTGADCLVTGCISCSNSMRRGDETVRTYHYLELLLGMPVDWDTFLRTQMDFDARDGYGLADPADDAPIFDEKSEGGTCR